MSENQYAMGIDRIQRFLPHRAPFLLVDKILEIKKSNGAAGTRVVGIKNISFNEPCFQGHFPGFSILPGVLVIESMAQVASFSLYPQMENDLGTWARDFRCILVGVDSARFRKPVIPGDILRIETVVTKQRGKLWAFYCEASVDGQIVAEADILANLVTKGEGL